MTTTPANPQFSVWLTCFFALLYLFSCNKPAGETGEAYREKINRWHEERIESLKEEDSWLSLAGLYPLEPGTQTFGADSSNDIIFPPGKAPDRIGKIILSGTSLELNPVGATAIEVDGTPVRNADTTITIASDAQQNGPTTMAYGSLIWYVIERGGDYFVRLKDTRNPRLSSFEGIERFPVASDWNIEATFKAFDEPRTLMVPNVLGQENEMRQYGTIRFSIDGKSYELAPLGDPEGDRFFIIFGDRTNGESTYGGGRFLYADTPDEDGTMHVDFNKAYNPPCVFNEFATCPLPPARNRLPVRITAGEKNYAAGSGTH